jgi:hypothetical protein
LLQLRLVSANSIYAIPLAKCTISSRGYSRQFIGSDHVHALFSVSNSLARIAGEAHFLSGVFVLLFSFCLHLFHLFLLLVGFLSCHAALGDWQRNNKKPIVEPNRKTENDRGSAIFRPFSGPL